MKFIDLKEMNCARSLILLKRVAKDAEDGEILRIECDKQEVYEGIIDYFCHNFLILKEEKVGNIFLLEAVSRKLKHNKEESSDQIIPNSRSACIVVINHYSLDPDDERKEKDFVFNFLHSFRELHILPQNFILYSSGVKLFNNSELKTEIRSFENCGSKVLVSRECAEMFEIEDNFKSELLVGSEEIILLLTGKDRIIYL